MNTVDYNYTDYFERAIINPKGYFPIPGAINNFNMLFIILMSMMNESEDILSELDDLRIGKSSLEDWENLMSDLDWIRRDFTFIIKYSDDWFKQRAKRLSAKELFETNKATAKNRRDIKVAILDAIFK